MKTNKQNSVGTLAGLTMMILVASWVPAAAQDDPTEPPADAMPACPIGVEVCTDSATNEFWVPITVQKDNGTTSSNPCDVWKEHVFLNTSTQKIKARPEIRCNGNQSNQNVFQLRLKRQVRLQRDPTLYQIDWAAPGGIFLHTFNLESIYCSTPGVPQTYYWDVSSYRTGSFFPMQHYNGPVSPYWDVIDYQSNLPNPCNP